MRWTNTFIPTLKETPAEAEIVSHKLLLRAGLIRKLAAGLYTFLPLGARTLHKIEQIIREEMNRAGAIEVVMPCLQPPEIWHQSGRYETMADVIFHVVDRAKREWLLGPTHEENITALVAAEINSYRQLPKNFYQITVKFRDEIRPRFGLMRAREFVMKDAYSFDIDDASAQLSYQKMFEAYERIFRRCGLKTVAVEAHTGAIGGSFSHEFMVPAESGENQIAFCEQCHYAANIEKATSKLPDTGAELAQEPPAGQPEEFPTPGVQTIEDLTRPPHNVPASRQIKTLVYVVESKPVILLLRGDDQLNEAKLSVLTGTTIFRPATAEEVFDLTGAHPGSLGAVSSTRLRPDVPVIADLRLRGARNMTTGANKDGLHIRNVDIQRDIKVDRWADLRMVQPGEPCPKCNNPLKVQHAIEVGHIFKLGTKYSERLGARYLDASGVEHLAVMGCYGIGVTRTLQAIVEQSNDKDGIIWPVSVAPYTVCVTALETDPAGAVFQTALGIYNDLANTHLDVILDDRDERPGVKFKDADLIGFPIRINVGAKSLAKGQVEIKLRATGEYISVAPDKVVQTTTDLLARLTRHQV